MLNVSSTASQSNDIAAHIHWAARQHLENHIYRHCQPCFGKPALEAERGLEVGHVGSYHVYRKVVPILKCLGLGWSEALSIALSSRGMVQKWVLSQTVQLHGCRSALCIRLWGRYI